MTVPAEWLWPAFALIGVAGGLLAGLFGIGGGLVIVPALAVLFAVGGFPADVVMHMAVGTSLATIVFTSVSSVVAHHRRGAVLWPVVSGLAPGLVLGALTGAGIAGLLTTVTLQRVFGVLLLAVAVRIALSRDPVARHALPGRIMLAAVGVIVGIVSALTGIGGGNLVNPYLLACQVPVRNAVATAAGGTLPVALAGAAGFVVAGAGISLPAGSTGYVYWPAVVGIVITSVLFAPLGARLAHAMTTQMLRRAFAVVLAVVALRMLLG